MSESIAISVQSLCKIYKLYDVPQDRLKESLHPLRKKYHREFHALHDVTFEIKKGESFGIIGKNGSGKSTLLKLITGVLTPSSGTVSVHGKLSALLELGAGFNPELTGVENVYFNGTLMGFSKDEIDSKLDSILAFADIGDFAHQPVKTYSSGMFVRLAFSVAVIVEPDILIVDEALSVGDVFFQQKCYAKIREIISRGTTCLFVSHDTQAIMNICSRVVLLDNGAVDYLGSPEEGISRYYGKMGKKPRSFAPSEPSESASVIEEELTGPEDVIAHNIVTTYKRHGAGGLVVAAARVTDQKGRDTLEVTMMEQLSFYILLEANEAVHSPSTGIHIYDRLGNLVFASGTRQFQKTLPDLQAGDRLIVQLRVTFSVQPGEYTFSIGTSEPSTDGITGYVHDSLEMLGPIFVRNPADVALPFYGIAQLPMSVFYSKQRTI